MNHSLEKDSLGPVSQLPIPHPAEAITACHTNCFIYIVVPIPTLLPYQLTDQQTVYASQVFVSDQIMISGYAKWLQFEHCYRI